MPQSSPPLVMFPGRTKAEQMHLARFVPMHPLIFSSASAQSEEEWECEMS